jgi:uncharacterized protein YjbI with pentapeptide repeats
VRAYLARADLSEADLREADLSEAYLRDADFTEANLKNATVIQARFGHNQGIDEALKTALITRGAIFEDSPGDRSSVPTLI